MILSVVLVAYSSVKAFNNISFVNDLSVNLTLFFVLGSVLVRKQEFCEKVMTTSGTQIFFYNKIVFK